MALINGNINLINLGLKFNSTLLYVLNNKYLHHLNNALIFKKYI